MNSKLLKSEVEKFITENYRSDLSRIIFSGSPFEGISTQEIAVQLKGKRTAEKKFPALFSSSKIIYPPGLNLEQASSKITAEYKASLVTGDTFIDLTGGLGIDSLHFSRKFENCVYCEINPEVAEIAAHNFKVLNRDNIEVHTTDGISFLDNFEKKYSCIYIDPSRREKTGGRVFRLSQCIPDVGKNLDLLFSKSSIIIIKTSPLLDLQAGISELQKVAEIHIVAVENDVKELIWILKETNDSRIIVKTVNFTKTRIEEYKNWFGENPQPEIHAPRIYLYEPNAAIMKSGLFGALGMDLNLEKLHPNSHLYTSDQLIDFPGRRFKIQNILPYNIKKIRKNINFEKAHIATRNFPDPVKVIRQKLKLSDGGENYLFFTTSHSGDLICIIAGKI